jgi:hypothetical protein
MPPGPVQRIMASSDRGRAVEAAVSEGPASLAAARVVACGEGRHAMKLAACGGVGGA